MINLQPCQQINIFLDTPEGEKVLSCYINEVYVDRIVLSKPQNYQEYISYLQEGEEIKTKVFTRLGVMLYKSLILNSVNEPEFVLEYNESMAQIVQRRVYSRIPLETVVDCEYDEVTKEVTENDGSKPLAVTAKPSKEVYKGSDKMVKFSTQISCEFETNIVEAETIDIGGGGLKIQSKSDLPYKKLITFKINLFDDIIVAKGTLVENNNYPEKQYGVRFTQISNEDKDKVIKTCFKIESILNRRND